MTREEAKRRLLNIERSLPNTFRTKEDVRNFEALEMAIKALEELPNRRKEAFNMAKVALEQEPCGDAISRQAVHIELEKWITYGEYKYSNATKYLYDRIDRLPPVNPQEPKYCDRNICVSNEYNGIGCDECEVTKSQEPKTGHWVMPVQDDGMSDPIYYQVRCSKCGFDLDPQTWHQELHQYSADNYCPNCGVKMVEQESEG